MTLPIAILEWQSWPGLLRYVLGDDVVRITIDPFHIISTRQFNDFCTNYPIICFQINFTLCRALPLKTQVLAKKLTKHGVYVVNGLIQDIRKSTLHKHLETLGLNSPKAAIYGNPSEKLFIKTNLNYGGAREKAIGSALQMRMGIHKLITDLDAYNYRVEYRGNLSQDIWVNPALVVERYISNPEDSFYRVYYAGKQVIIVKAFAAGNVKKIEADPRDTNYVSELDYLKDGSDGLPLSSRLKSEVVIFMDNTPLEFGCLDIVHDGQENHTIVDVNPTPSADGGDPNKVLSSFLKLGITKPSQRRTSMLVRSLMF